MHVPFPLQARYNLLHLGEPKRFCSSHPEHEHHRSSNFSSLCPSSLFSFSLPKIEAEEGLSSALCSTFFGLQRTGRSWSCSFCFRLRFASACLCSLSLAHPIHICTALEQPQRLPNDGWILKKTYLESRTGEDGLLDVSFRFSSRLRLARST